MVNHSTLLFPLQCVFRDTDSEQESGQESEFDPEEHSSQFTCAPCNKSYSNHNNLRAHLRLVHERAKPKSHKCGSCSKSFPKLAQLSQHVAWVHEQERWHCSICGKGLSSQRQWALHEVLVCKVADWSAERLKAEHGITLVNCPVEGCPKQFDSKRTTDMKLSVKMLWKCVKCYAYFCFSFLATFPIIPNHRIQELERKGEQQDLKFWIFLNL